MAVPTSGGAAIIREKQQPIKVYNTSKKSISGQRSSSRTAPACYRHCPVYQGKRTEKGRRADVSLP